jgi:branched-chain amino acid aminotransferase
MQFAFLNGRALEPFEMDVPFEGNRGILYGDGVFETIRVAKGKPLFFDDHHKRLIEGCRLLRLNLPDGCQKEALKKLIETTITTDSRVRLTVWRQCGGFYTPESNDSSWLLTFSELAAADGYQAQAASLTVYTDNKKSVGWLSNLKTLNGLIYVISAQFARSKGADESLILNSRGHVIESTSSNIFVLIGNTWHTPPLAEGCLDGVLRKNLLKLLTDAGIPAIEKELSLTDVMNADEILLTNVIKGIRQVKDIDGKKFEGRSAFRFTELLNKAVAIKF